MLRILCSWISIQVKNFSSHYVAQTPKASRVRIIGIIQKWVKRMNDKKKEILEKVDSALETVDSIIAVLGNVPGMKWIRKYLIEIKDIIEESEVW